MQAVLSGPDIQRITWRDAEPLPVREPDCDPLERAWIIGNGPSLSKTPLRLLAGETSFGLNRINLIWDKTDWRPTYYVRTESPRVADSMTYLQELKDIVATGIQCFLPKGWIREVGNHSNVTLINTCHHYKCAYFDKSAPHEWHLPFICDYASGVAVAMQIAVLRGFKSIYLLGCDLGYTDNGTSHFYQDTPEDRRIEANQTNLTILHAHMIARKSSPVPIYNATIGGNLEVHPRVDMLEVLRNG